jgi:hypothetical protein
MADTARLDHQFTAAPGCVTRARWVNLTWSLWLGIFLGFGVWNLGFFSIAATNVPSSDDIPPLRPPRDLIPPTYWEQHSTAIIVLSIVAVILVFVLLFLLLRPKSQVVIPPEVQARQALEQLRRKPEDGTVLSRVSQILRRYFAAVFKLPPGEMTTTEFCGAITTDTRIGPALSVPLVEFLRGCDERKFSPAPKSSPTGNAVETALRFIWLGQARLKEEQSKVQGLESRVPGPVSASSIRRLNDE